MSNEANNSPFESIFEKNPELRKSVANALAELGNKIIQKKNEPSATAFYGLLDGELHPLATYFDEIVKNPTAIDTELFQTLARMMRGEPDDLFPYVFALRARKRGRPPTRTKRLEVAKKRQAAIRIFVAHGGFIGPWEVDGKAVNQQTLFDRVKKATGYELSWLAKRKVRIAFRDEYETHIYWKIEAELQAMDLKSD
jgi:hypothetical protein